MTPNPQQLVQTLWSRAMTDTSHNTSIFTTVRSSYNGLCSASFSSGRLSDLAQTSSRTCETQNIFQQLQLGSYVNKECSNNPSWGNRHHGGWDQLDSSQPGVGARGGSHISQHFAHCQPLADPLSGVPNRRVDGSICYFAEFAQRSNP